ncbi:hypothetical protein Hanom_Chr12g01081541 [Helianthus anomalus]
MPRDVHLNLQCTYGDFREICRALSGNELTPDKILTTLTNTKFIRITYTYECGIRKDWSIYAATLSKTVF